MSFIRSVLGHGMLLLCVTSVLPAHTSLAQEQLDFESNKVFDEVSKLVKEHFFDKSFDSNAWDQRAGAMRDKAISATTHDQFDQCINELLTTLNTSHTYYYSRLNPKRYQLLGVFNQMYDQEREDLFVYDGVGIDTRTIAEKVYVSSVYDGLPAATAGLQFGDQIISVDAKPFHPIASFRGKAGSAVVVVVERDGQELTLPVTVDRLDGRTMFETALESSIRVIESNDQKVGYLHAWSYAGSKYHEQIRAAILWGPLSQCDALIVDLRDGWGGADINYLNLFRPPIAMVTSTPREGAVGSYSGVWEKPVALLTNGRSTSGKELFSYGFKKLKLGKIIGESTAGAVVAGRAFLLSNGDLLYLAVNDVAVDGQRLEGVGVEPDVLIPRPIDGSGEPDPQLEATLKQLAR